MERIEHIFLLNPPFSGSTAMADLLLKSPLTWSPWRNGEGQWVEEVTAEMRRDPWNPEVDFEWALIREAWLRRRPAGGRIMVEKSPPNLLRVRSIMAAFPNSVFVISNRDPYAWLGGVLHHDNYRREIRNPRRRAEIARHETRQWVTRTRFLTDAIEQVRGRSMITRYQDFCASPELFLRNLYNYCGDLRIDPHASVRVKNYPAQPIVNMNPLQIARLNSTDIAIANEVLADAEREMGLFGYRFMNPRARRGINRLRFPYQLRQLIRSGI
jgi:hypothetical protein